MPRPPLSPTLSRGLTLAALLIALAPAAASAQAISFKLAPRYSFATFKTDAPLETVVGHTADAGIDGALTLDPARPQAAAGAVKVDMNAVRTGIDKRDADMRGKSYLDTEVEADRWVTFEVKSVEVGAPLEGTVTYIKLSPEQVDIALETDLTFVRAQ